MLVIYFSNTFLVGYSSRADTKNSYLKTKQKLSYFQKETGSFTSNERRKSLKNNFSNFTKIPWKLFSLGRFTLVAKKALLLFLLPNWLKAKKSKFFCCLKQKSKGNFNFFESLGLLFLVQTSQCFCSTKKNKTICLLRPFFFGK